MSNCVKEFFNSSPVDFIFDALILVSCLWCSLARLFRAEDVLDDFLIIIGLHFSSSDSSDSSSPSVPIKHRVQLLHHFNKGKIYEQDRHIIYNKLICALPSKSLSLSFRM